MSSNLSLQNLLGPSGKKVSAAIRAGNTFLRGRTVSQLLPQVGQSITSIPKAPTISKEALQDSYGGSQSGPSNDLLAGYGLFYITEQRQLFLDCTAGHYQMLWGYNHPKLTDLIEEASRIGVVWDNHSNIPQAPLKQLAHYLTRPIPKTPQNQRLDTALLGVCTGSVACAAALKIQLRVHARNHGQKSKPVLITLAGNYHGTDMLPQFMRGMWPHLVNSVEVIILEPNDPGALELVFRKYGSRIAGFWAEPVMMNREAIPVDRDYLHLAQQLCRESGALLCIDEIQTGFWQPELFQSRALGLHPDLVVVGKGMTAGFHPLSGVLFNHNHDVLEQYDAISTNGSAALPAAVALASIELINQQASRIRDVAEQIEQQFKELAAEFDTVLQAAHGRGHLAGLKFREVDTAKRFQAKLLEQGLWTRVHAYHPGHRTILTKLGLLADSRVLGFVIAKFRQNLATFSCRSDTPRSKEVTNRKRRQVERSL